jgi:hypothetical protein
MFDLKAASRASALGVGEGRGNRRRGSQRGKLGGVHLWLNEDDTAVDGQRVEQDGEAGALVVREGDADAPPDRLLACGTIFNAISYKDWIVGHPGRISLECRHLRAILNFCI